jgi:enoyl-CoA hydratase
VLNRIAGMRKPTIAMIQGDAVGGGMFMSLACDLRVAAEHARFGVPIARTLGNFAAPVSLALLVATVGPVRAREMVITARLIGAAEARTMGLIDQVHPAGELEARGRELAARITEHAPLTLAAVKEATRRYIATVTPTSLEDLILSCYLSEDFQEGVSAFLEKRKANWKGR